MVRHVRFAWDHSRPLPDELISRGWDCDDAGFDDEDIPGRRRRSRKDVSREFVLPRCAKGRCKGQRNQP